MKDMNELIKHLTKLRKDYQKLVTDYEKRGTDNLDYEETECYGAYLGKVELCDYLIEKYSKK
jgi:hypothetical protein